MTKVRQLPILVVNSGWYVCIRDQPDRARFLFFIVVNYRDLDGRGNATGPGRHHGLASETWSRVSAPLHRISGTYIA